MRVIGLFLNLAVGLSHHFLGILGTGFLSNFDASLSRSSLLCEIVLLYGSAHFYLMNLGLLVSSLPGRRALQSVSHNNQVLVPLMQSDLPQLKLEALPIVTCILCWTFLES